MKYVFVLIASGTFFIGCYTKNKEPSITTYHLPLDSRFKIDARIDSLPAIEVIKKYPLPDSTDWNVGAYLKMDSLIQINNSTLSKRYRLSAGGNRKSHVDLDYICRLILIEDIGGVLLELDETGCWQ